MNTTPSRLPLFKRAALLTLVAALAACGSKEGRVESGLKKGAEFVSAGDWDKANVEVRNVLQIEPKNGRAYLIAAQASEGQRDPRKAYGQYLKAVELQPDLLDAKTGLARLLLLNGELPQARGHVDQVLAADPKHAMARTLKGAILAREGKNDEALAVVEQVLRDVSPVPADARLLLAGLQANRKAWPQALATIDAGLKDDPRHTGLLQAAVEIAASNPGDTAIASQAAGFYKRAVQASPKNHDLWLAWARHHQNRQETDLAESVMREAIKAQPDDGKRRLALADFLLATRGAAVAEQQYLSNITERPRDMALRFGLANLYRGSGRPLEAQQVLQQIVDLSDDGPNVVIARTQLAQYALAAGKTDVASALLAEVLKANPRDNAALVLRSRIHLASGQPGDAVVDLRAALRDQQGSVELVQLLAQAHRMAKEPQLAREVLGDAIKAKPDDPTLRALLAADMADSADFKGAHAELDAAIKALPQATRLYELKVQIALSQNDPALAIKTLEQLKARQPQSALPYLRLGQLYTAQKRLDAALKEYDAGTAAAPSDPSAYIAAVTLLSSTKRHDEATARIQARMKAEPANMLHRQLAAELALNRRDLASAEREYRAVIAGSPNAASGYLGVAKVLGAKGDAEGALAALADGEKAVPNDRGVPMARAEWLTRLKRNDEAIAAYETLRTRFPDDDTVVNNLAYLLAEVKGDKASAERALSLASRFAQSRNPGHLDSLGWIHYRLGQYDKALPLLEKAVALAQPSPLLELHLGKALVKTGDTARGRALIQKAIDSKVNLPRLDEARALLAQG